MKAQFLLILSACLCLASIGQTETITLTRGETALHAMAAEPILQEAYHRAGLELVVTPLPSKRALVTSSEGEVDGEVIRILAIGDRYPSLRVTGPPVASLRSGVFFREGMDVEVTGPEDLAPYTVAVLRGIAHANDNARFAGTLHVVDSFDSLVRLLEAGRVDAVVHSVMPFQMAVAEVGATQINTEPTVLSEIPLYHFLHESNADLIPEIAAILQDMDTAGEVDALFEAGLQTLR